MKKELTLLTKKEVCGDSNNSGMLDSIAHYGSIACLTDLAILTDDYVYDDLYSSQQKKTLKERPSYYWTQTDDGDGDVIVIDDDGYAQNDTRLSTQIAIRPVLVFDEKYDEISANVDDEVWNVELYEYPQYAPDIEIQEELEALFCDDKLVMTDKTYPLPSDLTSENIGFSNYEEYEYKGKRYIRYFISNKKHFSAVLSNGKRYYNNEYVWIEVSPVVWLAGRKSKKFVSKRCLLAGVKFNIEKYDGNFVNTNMKKYLDTYMLDSILIHGNIRMNGKKNPYGFDYKNVSEEDIIEACIKSDIPIFLHGRSGDGKSARVMEIDPNCIKLSIAGSDPEKIVGKTVYSGRDEEMIYIKPVWLKKLYEICEAEPDKLHVVFLDEITNAVPSLQTMAFDIVLYKVVNGMWELPKNSRVVAAGNETEESIAAYGLSEPLFGRFAHVYIKTTAEIWLPWAIEHNIHPAIYAYIAYMKDKALRTEYNGLTPNADPRKWEMASNMLYATMRPEALRALIGDALTREFVAFCKNTVITIDDVLSGNYDENKVKELNPAKKYATVMTLSLVDDKNFMKVREFVKIIEPEYLAVFDSLWARKDEKRLELLAVINEQEKKRGIRR